MINFSYQYLPEAKVYLEPSRTFYNGAFSRNIFFAKLTRKQLCRSLILIKLQVSILQLHWKKGLQHSCFLMNFARYLRHLFYRTPPGDCFCSTEKIFYQQNSKEPSHRQNKNLITLYIKSSYPFTIQRCLYFSFSCFLWYIENTSF